MPDASVTGPAPFRNRLLECGFAFACIVLSLTLIVAHELGYWPKRYFESTAWQLAAGTSSDVRISMIDHLVGSEILNGMTRENVIAMLGIPYDGSYFREHDLVYYLGGERGWMGIDSEWLVVDFDTNGRVKSYQVVTD